MKSDSAVLAAVTNMLRVRAKRMSKALDAKRLSAGKHLDEGAPERAYWHAGYVAAMRDALRMIDRRESEYPMTMQVLGKASGSVIRCLETIGRPCRIKEIAASTKRSYTRTRQIVERLVKDGAAERIVIHGSRIEYRLDPNRVSRSA